MNQIAVTALTASFTLFFSPPAYADVNMLEGSFRTTFIDAQVAGFKIERRYDSRSTFTGLFGFGWCSTFDSQLDLNTLKAQDCGKTSGVTVRYSNGTYVQVLANGLTRTFDADTGALIALQNGRGSSVEIDGAPGAPSAAARSRLPRAAALGEGMKTRPRISLEFDGLHENVIALTTPSSRLTFDYNDKHDLLAARNAWNNLYRFDYDRLHNLTQISYPDGTSEEATYDTDHDRLTQFQGRDRCIETYEHTISASANERHQTSIAKLSCDGKPKRQAVFRFGFIRKIPGAANGSPSSYQLNSFERGTK